MLDLLTLDPARQSADRRVALVAGFGAVVIFTLAAVTSGGGGWALAIGGAVCLAGLPWFFAFGARWRLLDDALDGVPFAWRGDRSGVWATAPVAGALATLVLVAALGFPSVLALLACLAGAAAYTAADRLRRGPLRARDPPRPHRPRTPLPADHRHPRVSPQLRTAQSQNLRG